METTYYDTTGVDKQTLLVFKEKARTQDRIIERFFRRNPYQSFTPGQVLDLTGLQCPLTSIRRSMTNLTTAGVLAKTGEKRNARFGRENYCWRLRKEVAGCRTY